MDFGIVYSKTFEWGNFRAFRGFSANHERFPLESLNVYSTRWPRAYAPQKFSSEWCILHTTANFSPLESFAVYGISLKINH